MKKTPDLLAALDYLHNAPEMRTIRAWLGDQRKETTERAIRALEDVDAQRGYARALMDLHDLFENAPNERKRLENRNGKAQKPGHPRYPGSS